MHGHWWRGCAGAILPAAIAGAIAAPTIAVAQRSALPAAQPLLAGKIWLATDPAAAPGTLRVFLPDGTLVMTSCVETYRLARWTSMGDRRISWQEDTARIDARITTISAEELVLELQLRDGVRQEHYRVAAVPYVCPDLRPGPSSSDLRVEGTLIYLERIALPASATVRVELRDTSRADAAARPLATQTIPANQGPPFHYALAVSRATIDPRAHLSLFAEIRDGDRLLFTTTTERTVPPEGATGLDIRLTFVSSGRGLRILTVP